MCFSFEASAGVVGLTYTLDFVRFLSGKRHGRCPLRVPFDPMVAALGVAYFQMDLSSGVQEAQTVAAGGDIVELRLLWVVSRRIALSSEEPSPGDTGTISCLRTLSSGGKSV